MVYLFRFSTRKIPFYQWKWKGLCAQTGVFITGWKLIGSFIITRIEFNEFERVCGHFLGVFYFSKLLFNFLCTCVLHEKKKELRLCAHSQLKWCQFKNDKTFYLFWIKNLSMVNDLWKSIYDRSGKTPHTAILSPKRTVSFCRYTYGKSIDFIDNGQQ